MRRDWAAHCRTHGLDSTRHRPWQWQRRRLLYVRAAGPNAAATSADTDEHGRVGVDGLVNGPQSRSVHECLEVGARANFEMVTASLWYNMGQTDTKIGTDSLDIDPELLGLDVAISFAPDAPELVLGYVDATHELEIDNDKLDLDYDHFSIGVRKSF